MDIKAKEWGDKTHVTITDSPFFDNSTAVFNMRFKDFAKAMTRRMHEKVPMQVAFPNLSADEREFLISGCPIGEFDGMFAEEKGEEPHE
jgi:hypothetical protein